FAGDLLWFGFFPNVREANVPNQISVINRILEFKVKYYVPGHGHISSDRTEVIKLRDFLADLYERIHSMVKAGKDIEAVRALEQELVSQYPDWIGRQFLTWAIDVIYQTHRERYA
ncbi:hypothetical protein ACFL0M_11915, partial [Thermodesulfobacteriota bacterium]